MANEKDKPYRLRLPGDAKVGGPVPQPNPILKWISDKGDQIVGGAEMAAGLFDGNPGPEILKAISILPPAMAKKFGEQLLTKLKESGQWGPEMMEAFTAAQQRYPRLFGHIRAVKPPLHPFERASGVQGAGWRGAAMAKQPASPGRKITTNPGWDEAAPYLPDDKKVQASLNTSTLGFKAQPRNPVNTVHHELTHAAQQLRRGGDFEDAYRQAADLVGYQLNPYEVRARQGGARATLRHIQAKPDNWRTIQNLENVEEADLTAGEKAVERIFREYIGELRANQGNVTPRATELYESLRRLGKGSRSLEPEEHGLNVGFGFGRK